MLFALRVICLEDNLNLKHYSQIMTLLFYTDYTCFRDPTYLKIVQRLEERKQAPYSIHQVALMGACEGKEVGQWFGPNTVAQVLK